MAKKKAKKKELKKKDAKKKANKKELKKKNAKKKANKKENQKKDAKKKKSKKKDSKKRLKQGPPISTAAVKPPFSAPVKPPVLESKFTDHSSNYKVSDAVKKLRSLKNTEELLAFTKGEKRLTITRILPGAMRRKKK